MSRAKELTEKLSSVEPTNEADLKSVSDLHKSIFAGGKDFSNNPKAVMAFKKEFAKYINPAWKSHNKALKAFLKVEQKRLQKEFPGTDIEIGMTGTPINIKADDLKGTANSPSGFGVENDYFFVINPDGDKLGRE